MFLPRSIVRLLSFHLASVRSRGTISPSVFGQEAAPTSSSQATPPSAPQPAQPQQVHLKDYSVPRSSFPLLKLWCSRTCRNNWHSRTGGSVLIPLLRDGKLYISMNDAIALALENNLDIAIARYNLNIADTDVSARQGRRQHSRRE